MLTGQLVDIMQGVKAKKYMSGELVLHLKREYFDQIALGTKKLEYRLRTPYWERRLVGREYKTIRLLCGYPKRGDKSKEIVCKYEGYEVRVIKHPHFGKKPVRVFEIYVHEQIAVPQISA